MNAGRWVLVLSVGASLASCGDETGSSGSGLNGSFEGRYAGSPTDRLDDQYLGLSLAENEGVVSGHAFYWYTPGYAATVTGTFDGEEFDLTLRAVFYGATDLRRFAGVSVATRSPEN